jgi:hypothetical protein
VGVLNMSTQHRYDRLDPDRPQWSGPPVNCTGCPQQGVPVWTDKGWTFPPHELPAQMRTALNRWCSMSAEALPGQDQLPGPRIL